MRLDRVLGHAQLRCDLLVAEAAREHREHLALTCCQVGCVGADAIPPSRSDPISATINEDYKDWREIKRIQMTATCAEVRGKLEAARALTAYVKKYPFVGSFLQPGRLLEGMQIGGRPLSVRLYKITPSRVLFLNNAQGFSHREEIPL